MSEAKPTPGPWWDEDGVIYGKSRSDVIAQVAEILGYPDEEEGATARLIAAAPELLGAGRDAALHYQALEEGFIADGLEEVAKDCAETRRALQKAIAKAEGRQ